MQVLRIAANDHVVGGTAVSGVGTWASAEDLKVGTAATVHPDPVALDAISAAGIATRLAGLPGKTDFTIWANIAVTPMPVIGFAANSILRQGDAGAGKQ